MFHRAFDWSWWEVLLTFWEEEKGTSFCGNDHSPVNVWCGESQSHLYPSIIESRHSCFILFYFLTGIIFFAIKISNFGLTPGDTDSHALRVFYWGHVYVNPGASMEVGGILKGFPQLLFSFSAWLSKLRLFLDGVSSGFLSFLPMRMSYFIGKEDHKFIFCLFFFF